jgi:hypothetical protein
MAQPLQVVTGSVLAGTGAEQVATGTVQVETGTVETGTGKTGWLFFLSPLPLLFVYSILAVNSF